MSLMIMPQTPSLKPTNALDWVVDEIRSSGAE